MALNLDLLCHAFFILGDDGVSNALADDLSQDRIGRSKCHRM